MAQQLTLVTLVVPDYDRAIAYYTEVLGFSLVADEPRGNGKRWVVVWPPGSAPGSEGCGLLLARADSERQAARVGDQTGGRVFLFLRTDDFWRDYQAMKARGVEFAEEPREEVYGTVVVFEDVFGNRWDLLGPPG